VVERKLLIGAAWEVSKRAGAIRARTGDGASLGEDWVLVVVLGRAGLDGRAWVRVPDCYNGCSCVAGVVGCCDVGGGGRV
jgi:hypothetical protein